MTRPPPAPTRRPPTDRHGRSRPALLRHPDRPRPHRHRRQPRSPSRLPGCADGDRHRRDGRATSSPHPDGQPRRRRHRACRRSIVPPGEGSKSFAAPRDGRSTALLAARLERSDVVARASAAAWSAISPASPPASCAAACASSRCRRRCSPRSIPRSAARPASTPAAARTSSASSTSPSFVLADAGVLDTLPPRDFNAGYAEVAKYGLIGDADFFDWLESNWRAVAAGWPEREHAIAVACRAKAAIVAADERDERQPRPPQSRPHLRPRARSRHRLFRPPRPRRGGRRSAWCSPLNSRRG